jgi:rubrerythrin
MTQKELKIILEAQKIEISELAIYSYLKQKENNPDNKRILELIINDEKNIMSF